MRFQVGKHHGTVTRNELAPAGVLADRIAGIRGQGLPTPRLPEQINDGENTEDDRQGGSDPQYALPKFFQQAVSHSSTDSRFDMQPVSRRTAVNGTAATVRLYDPGSNSIL